jgi:cytochrome c
MKSLKIMLIATAMSVGAMSHAHAAGDAAQGSKAFEEECADCHSLKEGKNKKGPSLFAIVGRKSATIADFNYSDAMRAKNVVWTSEAISEYIKAPKKVVPGGKMKYDGLPEDALRADIIAFLSAQH